jgi:hypothetical protein
MPLAIESAAALPALVPQVVPFFWFVTGGGAEAAKSFLSKIPLASPEQAALTIGYMLHTFIQNIDAYAYRVEQASTDIDIDFIYVNKHAMYGTGAGVFSIKPGYEFSSEEEEIFARAMVRYLEGVWDLSRKIAARPEYSFVVDIAGEEFKLTIEDKLELEMLALQLGVDLAISSLNPVFSNEVVGRPILTRTDEGYKISTEGHSVNIDGSLFRIIRGNIIPDGIVREIAAYNRTFTGTISDFDYINNIRFFPYFTHEGETYIFSRHDSSQIHFSNQGFMGLRVMTEPQNHTMMMFGGMGLNAGSAWVIQERRPGEINDLNRAFTLSWVGGNLVYQGIDPQLQSAHLRLSPTVLRMSDGQLVNWYDVLAPGNATIIQEAVEILREKINVIVATAAEMIDVLSRPGIEIKDEEAIIIPKHDWEKVVDKAIKERLVERDSDIVISPEGIQSIGGIDINELMKLLNITVEVTPTVPADLFKTMEEILEEMRTQTALISGPGIPGSPGIADNLPFFQDLFPFSIVYDYMYFLELFNTRQEPPIFTYNIRFINKIFTVNEQIVIDPTMFKTDGGVDMIQIFVRSAIIILVITTLIRFTVKLVISFKI